MSGSKQTEQRGPEQQAGDQLAHHRRLADAQHGFAEQAADDHQRQDVGDEQRLGGPFMRLLGAKGRRCRQQQHGDQ